MDRDDFKAGIGRRMKAARVEIGLSLDDLAAATDMSKTALWQIETGQTEPKASTLLRLSIQLRCSIDYLVRGDDENAGLADRLS